MDVSTDIKSLTWPYRYGLVTTIVAAVLLVCLVIMGFYFTGRVRVLTADVARLSSVDTTAYNLTIRTLDEALKDLQVKYDSLDAAKAKPIYVTPTQNLTDAELQALLKRRLKGNI